MFTTLLLYLINTNFQNNTSKNYNNFILGVSSETYTVVEDKNSISFVRIFHEVIALMKSEMENRLEM